MKIFDTKITKKQMVSENYMLLEVAPIQSFPSMEGVGGGFGSPGQFYQIKLPTDDHKLRVPISIFDVTTPSLLHSRETKNAPLTNGETKNAPPTTTEWGGVGGGRISFLIKIIGEKTQKLASLKENDTLNLLGPLGNTFDTFIRIPNTEHRTPLLFVTGGIGYAPLNYLYNELLRLHNSETPTSFNHPDSPLRTATPPTWMGINWIHGGRNRGEVTFPLSEQKAQIIYTDDGSAGKKGFVTDAVANILSIKNYHPQTEVIACGPKPMLHALYKITQKYHIPLIVSLEEYMACGVGVCYGCAVKVRNADGKEAYQRVCKEGAIFDAERIVW